MAQMSSLLSPGKPQLARTSQPSGSVTGVRVQPSLGQRRAGQLALGWQHCLHMGGGGGIAEHVAAVPGVGGWDGCTRCPVGSPGDVLRADGSGSFFVRSWHSNEVTSSACLPVTILQGVGLGGRVFLVLCASGGHTLLLTALPLSAQQIRADPEQEVHSVALALWGTCRGQLSPPGMALKPE